jgi:hypothetical protein
MKRQATEVEAELRRLRDELFRARRTILELIAPEAREILGAHRYCESFGDIHDWRTWAVGRLMAIAFRSAIDEGFGSPRAVCPLCGDRSTSPRAHGFALPLGLERHLRGSHGGYQCGVFRAADQEALEDQWERDHPSRPKLVLSGPGFVTPAPPWKARPTESGNVIPLNPSDN